MFKMSLLILLTLVVSACQSPVGQEGDTAVQNGQYLSSLDGVQLPFELAIPSELPGGYALATAPVVAEAATGNSIVLLSFTDAGNERTPRPVRICVSDDPATADSFCSSDASPRLERELGNAVIVVTADMSDSGALQAWSDVSFRDLAEGDPAWVDN